jgi:ferritin-like metal-binding protein YciE
MHKLTSVYLLMLNNMLSIEDQLINGMPQFINSVSNPELKNALAAHQDDIQLHKARLSEILEHHSQLATNEHDAAFETMLQDMALQLSLIDDQNVKDAFVIASVKTIEHHEISRYETLVDWARELGDEFGAELLRKTLAEEQDGNKKLIGIAQGGLFSIGVNEQAVLTDDE